MATLTNQELTAILLDHINNCSGGGTTPSTPGYTPTGSDYEKMLSSWSSIATALRSTLTNEAIYATSVAGTTITVDNAWSLFTTAVTDALKTLDADKLEEEDLDEIILELDTLSANFANIDTLLADYIKASDIVTGTLTTEVLLASTAKFLSLISTTVSATGVQSYNITSDHITIADAFIKNAMVESISAGKVTSGELDTNKVIVRSTDGNLKIDKAQIIITDDDDTVRVLVGKTSDGDYTLTLWDADGECIWDAEGIKRDAFKDAIIDNDCVAPNANISASKLNITSLITSLNTNGGIRTSAANIIVDADNHTLNTWLSTMDTWKSGIANRMDTVETEISVIDGELSTFAKETDITQINTTINGMQTSITNLSDNYTSLTQTTTSLGATISSLQTEIEGIEIPDLDDYVTADDFEDAINELDNAMVTMNTNITNIGATVDGITTSVTSNSTSIGNITDSLELLQSAMDNSAFVGQDTIDSLIEDYSTKIEQTSSYITTTINSTIAAEVDGKFVEVTDYSRWFTEDADGLTIGSSGSPIKLQMSNNGIRFIDPTTNPATEIGFWDGDMFHSHNIKVDVNYSAQFGSFEWVPKSDGTLVLRRINND